MSQLEREIYLGSREGKYTLFFKEQEKTYKHSLLVWHSWPA